MTHILIHSLEHSFSDSLKILPFLFLTYLIMEVLEKKTGEKTNLWLEKAGKAGPIAGGILGVIPQCGMSTVASNLYAGRIISVGTLIAIYLSTSDVHTFIQHFAGDQYGIFSGPEFIQKIFGTNYRIIRA